MGTREKKRKVNFQNRRHQNVFNSETWAIMAATLAAGNLKFASSKQLHSEVLRLYKESILEAAKEQKWNMREVLEVRAQVGMRSGL